MERHIAAGDRGRAGAAIGLQYIAVDRDLALAELGQIGDRAQAAADQPLDFLRASALPAARRLAVGAGRRRARQHPVFRSDPSLAGIAQERRHPLLDRGGAQHMGVAEFREARAFGIFGDARLEGDRPHRIAGASRGSHGSPTGRRAGFARSSRQRLPSRGVATHRPDNRRSHSPRHGGGAGRRDSSCGFPRRISSTSASPPSACANAQVAALSRHISGV